MAVLETQGFVVYTAGDGAVGVEEARRLLPDLILCDVRMPGGDGFEALSALRKDHATAHIPFIFLSGAVDKGNMRQGMELGADDYLTKPFSFEELIGAVNSQLKKQEVARELSEKKLRKLSGNISLALPHELLTPLHGILGLASLMMEDYERMKPHEIFDYARSIHESGQRLNRLIENFLAYSRIELVASDPAKVEALRLSGQVQVYDAVQEVFARLAKRYGRETDLVMLVEEVTIPVETDNFKKICEELLDNAFKFSQPGTQVRVTGTLDNGLFTMSVTNQGRGMTSEQIAHIGAHMQFERQHYEQQGSGLGLIIAKRLTELYGGGFHIQSTPGESTVVSSTFVTVPQSQGVPA